MEQSGALIQKINFDGDMVAIVDRDGEQFVAMKPICEAIGLDWESQRQLLERELILNQVTCTVQNQSLGADGKTYNVEMICLPLSHLNGWLFKINPARYEGERREKIIRYQKECYQVLFDHFFGKRLKSSTFQAHQTLRKERLILTERRNLDGLVKREVRRILAGNGTLEDLDDVPTIQEAVRSALEKLPKKPDKAHQVDPIVMLLNDIRADYAIYGDLHTKYAGIRIKIEGEGFQILASSRGLFEFCQAYASPQTRELTYFRSPKGLTAHLQAAQTEISNQGWKFKLNERKTRGNRFGLFVSDFPWSGPPAESDRTGGETASTM